ncbi:MAG: alpha/beta hydrolase fold domain-containing protein [Kiritimatiellales bacterium]
MRSRQRFVLITAGLGMAVSVFADFRDFRMTGTGTDDQWSTLANWEEGSFPTSAEHARIDKDCHIANGVSGTALAVLVAGASSVGNPTNAELYVDSGGSLTVGSSGISLSYWKKTSLLDVSGSVNTSGGILLGAVSNAVSTATVNIRAGGSVRASGINLGALSPGGTYTVNQSGGDVTLSSELKIGDLSDSVSSNVYSISGGTLRALRLNTGGNGTTAAKFSVVGSNARISFSGTSWLGGETELEFILDASGVSALIMTNGGYTRVSTAKLTVDASAFSGSVGTGILLIDADPDGTLYKFNNVSVTEGYELDYHSGRVYLVKSSDAASPAALSIGSAAADSVAVTATGLTAAAMYSLECLSDLMLTNWTPVASVRGIAKKNWMLSSTNAAMFYRLKPQAVSLLRETSGGTPYQLYTDVSYVGTAGPQRMDVYCPSNSTAARPGVLIIHGGGWSMGDKADVREVQFAEFMVDEGYVAVSINYLLAVNQNNVLVESSWPQNIYDCKSALRWMRKNADMLGLDPNRIAVMGGSAGGHLSLLTGLSAGDAELNAGGEYTDQDNTVRCIVDFYGIPDVREWGGSAFIDVSQEEAPEVWAQASPVTHLSDAAPPILIVHGTADDTVNIALSEEFVGILTARNLTYQYLPIEGAGHSFTLTSTSVDLRPVVRAFLNEYLR